MQGVYGLVGNSPSSLIEQTIGDVNNYPVLSVSKDGRVTSVSTLLLPKIPTTTDFTTLLGLPSSLSFTGQSGQNLSIGTSLQITSGTGTGATLKAVTINAIQDIRTTATPQFARLGIGVAADATELVLVQKNQNAFTDIIIKNTTAGSGSGVALKFVSDTSTGASIGVYSSTTTPTGILVANSLFLYEDVAAGIAIMANNGSAPIVFASGGTAEVARFTSGGNFSLIKLISTYNNITTAGLGVAPIVDDQPLTGKTADIVDTNFNSAGTAGRYRVDVYIVSTTSAVGAGAVTANIKFKDISTGTQTFSVGPVALSAAGAVAQGTIFCQLGSGNITYGTTHTGIFSTAQYAVYFTCERLV